MPDDLTARLEKDRVDDIRHLPALLGGLDADEVEAVVAVLPVLLRAYDRVEKAERERDEARQDGYKQGLDQAAAIMRPDIDQLQRERDEAVRRLRRLARCSARICRCGHHVYRHEWGYCADCRCDLSVGGAESSAHDCGLCEGCGDRAFLARHQEAQG